MTLENAQTEFVVDSDLKRATGAVFALSLLTYLVTLAPTVTGEDSGEFVAAAYTLGIPHPPGYPLWCLITRIFMLVAVGDIACRSAFTTPSFCWPCPCFSL